MASAGASDVPPEVAAFFQKRPPGSLIIHDPPKLDLETYANQYKGHVRFNRLYEIATTSVFLAVDALRMMVLAALEDDFVAGYLMATELLATLAPNDSFNEVDNIWVEEQRTTDRNEVARLRGEIRAYQENMIKESIRLAVADLASQQYRIGMMPEAEEAFKKSLHYCQTFKQRLEVYNNLLLIYVVSECWGQVEWVLKRMVGNGKHTTDELRQINTITSIMLGIINLRRGNFLKASSIFMATPKAFISYRASSHPDKEIFKKLPISPADLGLYGTLTTLASLANTPNSLESIVVQSTELRNGKFSAFVDLDPNCQRIVKLFEKMKFAECLDLLHSFRNDYLLDPYLRPQVDALLAGIRENCIVYYCHAFSTLRIGTLEKKFPVISTGSGREGGKEKSMEDEVIGIIERKMFDFRYNKVHKYIERPLDPLSYTHVQLKEAFLQDAMTQNPGLIKASLVRAHMIGHGYRLPDVRELKKTKAAELSELSELLPEMGAGGEDWDDDDDDDDEDEDGEGDMMDAVMDEFVGDGEMGGAEGSPSSLSKQMPLDPSHPTVTPTATAAGAAATDSSTSLGQLQTERDTGSHI